MTLAQLTALVNQRFSNSPGPNQGDAEQMWRGLLTILASAGVPAPTATTGGTPGIILNPIVGVAFEWVGYVLSNGGGADNPTLVTPVSQLIPTGCTGVRLVDFDFDVGATLVGPADTAQLKGTVSGNLSEAMSTSVVQKERTTFSRGANVGIALSPAESLTLDRTDGGCALWVRMSLMGVP